MRLSKHDLPYIKALAMSAIILCCNTIVNMVERFWRTSSFTSMSLFILSLSSSSGLTDFKLVYLALFHCKSRSQLLSFPLLWVKEHIVSVGRFRVSFSSKVVSASGSATASNVISIIVFWFSGSKQEMGQDPWFRWELWHLHPSCPLFQSLSGLRPDCQIL